MKTPKHFFNLESTVSKTEEQLIFFNMSYGYKEFNTLKNKMDYTPFRISTQQRIEKRFWDSVNYKANPAYIKTKGKTLNDELHRVEKASNDALTSFYSEHSRIPSPSELKELVLIKLDRKVKIIKDISLKSYISGKLEYFKSLPLTSANKVQKGTIQTYAHILTQIEKYETKRNEILTFQNFDETKYWTFFEVINEIYKEEHHKENAPSHGYMVNSIAKISKTFLSLLKMAKQDEVPMILNLDKKGLRIQELKKSNEVYINQNQLQEILNANVAHSSEFTNAKNYLIISSLTGLRYEDMYELNKLKISPFNGKNRAFNGFITPVRKVSRVNKEVNICVPLFKPVAQLVAENGGKFPAFPKNQPMNRQLKKFCEYLGFDDNIECTYWYYKHEKPVIEYTPMHKLIETHTGRKTFYTNLTQLQISENIIETITHPKFSSKTMAGVYNNSSIIDNAEVLLDSIDKCDSGIYKY